MDIKDLPALAIEVCKKREWSLHWTARHSYLTLESAELIEAIRGKGGIPLEEAADVLFVLTTITQAYNIPFDQVIECAFKKANHLLVAPRYKGEEFGEKHLPSIKNEHA